MNKNLRLVAVLAFLISMVVIFLIWDKADDQNYPTLHFAYPESINAISIEGQEKVELTRNQNSWMVNQSKAMDAGLSKVSLALMEKIRVKRELQGDEKNDWYSKIKSNGLKVQVESEREKSRAFEIVGDGRKTFVLLNGNVYEVHLPGYDSYIAGLFEIKPEDWRSRRIYEGTGQSLFNLTWKTPTDSLSIQYQLPFYKINGIDQFDTLSVVESMEQALFWQFDGLVSAPIDTPQQVLTVQYADLNPALNTQLTFYPLENQYLVNFNQEWALLSDQKMQFWLQFKENLRIKN